MKLGAPFSHKTQAAEIPRQTKNIESTKTQPSQPSSKNKGATALLIASAVLHVLFVGLMLAAGITFITLIALGSPLIQSFAIAGIITLVGAFIGIVLLILTLFPQKERSVFRGFLIPPILIPVTTVPPTSYGIPKRETLYSYNTKLGLLNNCSLSLKELPPKAQLPKGTKITNGASIEVHCLKENEQFKIITAKAPNLPDITENGVRVPFLFLLPPETSHWQEEKAVSTPLKELQEFLGKDQWLTMKAKMDSRKQAGQWAFFSYNSSEVVLAWTPWGCYDKDVAAFLQRKHRSNLSFDSAETSYFTDSENFLEELFVDLIESGIRRIHLHGVEVFSPLNHAGQPHFTQNTFLPTKLLRALNSASQKATRQPDSRFTLFLTQEDRNPLHDEKKGN
ncbi:hypothetical protein [Candidatus Chlamydia corallus]|uniref:hypothetical protein n=1 Tax=Candidatus Chlamydia corallus TaxID=2038470 RepID=UPI001EFE3AB0|nr:hypothetical protein [Candidatus Chlamydia corallus]